MQSKENRQIIPIKKILTETMQCLRFLSQPCNSSILSLMNLFLFVKGKQFVNCKIPSVKIGIEFKQRFWENFNLGNAITDYPTRFSYILSHNIGSNGSGVILACYCWGHGSLL